MLFSFNRFKVNVAVRLAKNRPRTLQGLAWRTWGEIHWWKIWSEKRRINKICSVTLTKSSQLKDCVLAFKPNYMVFIGSLNLLSCYEDAAVDMWAQQLLISFLEARGLHFPAKTMTKCLCFDLGNSNLDHTIQLKAKVWLKLASEPCLWIIYFLSLPAFHN